MVAVTVAFWLLLTVPDVAAKVALLWPEGTVTVGARVSNPLLLVSDTTAGLVATLLSVTVQVLEALLPSVEGAQASDVSCAGALRFNVLFLLTPPLLAVTTAV